MCHECNWPIEPAKEKNDGQIKISDISRQTEEFADARDGMPNVQETIFKKVT
jgi:hypothetical protein